LHLYSGRITLRELCGRLALVLRSTPRDSKSAATVVPSPNLPWFYTSQV
jgi:hypothetical protein